MILMVVLVVAVILGIGGFSVVAARQKKAWQASVEASWASIVAYRPTEALSAEQLFQLLLTGNLFVANQDNFNQLRSNRPPADIAEVLAKFWGIEDDESLAEALDRVQESYASPDAAKAEALRALRDGKKLETAQFAGAKSVVTFLKAHEAAYVKEITPDCYQTAAWDIERLASLARWGATVGFLDTEEAWRLLGWCAQEARRMYGSYAAYSLSYLINRGMWSPVDMKDAEDWTQLVQAHAVLTRHAESPLKKAAAWA